MDELLKAIKENDLVGFIRAIERLIIVQPSPKEDAPAKSDQQMINDILIHQDVLPNTRTIITGIGKFLDERGYITERQRETVLAMHRQFNKT